MAQKWNWKTQQYEPYTLPLNAIMYSFDFDQTVACAGCGSYLKYGECFICPVCGEPVFDTYQRIVGYLVPTRSYSKDRKREFSTRQWYEYAQMVGE